MTTCPRRCSSPESSQYVACRRSAFGTDQADMHFVRDQGAPSVELCVVALRFTQ